MSLERLLFSIYHHAEVLTRSVLYIICYPVIFLCNPIATLIAVSARVRRGVSSQRFFQVMLTALSKSMFQISSVGPATF